MKLMTKEIKKRRKRDLLLLRAVQEELARREWSNYDLAKKMRGKICPAATYNWLAGTTDMNASSVGMILRELELTVVRENPPKVARKKK